MAIGPPGGSRERSTKISRSTIWLGITVLVGVVATFGAAFLTLLRSPPTDLPPPLITPSATSTIIPTDEPSTTSAPSETPSPTDKPGDSELEGFLRKCKSTLEGDRQGQVAFPADMQVKVGEGQPYNAAVDIRTNPAPPKDVIDAPNPRSEPIRVECVLSARLTAASKGMEVVPSSDATEDGWRTLRFAPDGVIEWSWTVTATVPVDQILQLELQPAVQIGESSESTVRASTAYYTTEVFVDGTIIERVAHWFDTQFSLLEGIVSAIGLAILGLLAFSTKFRETIQALFKRKPAATADSAAAAKTVPEPTSAGQQKSKQKSKGKGKGKGK